MENTFYLEIITPDRQFYTGPADSLVMPALDGEYGVQPGHEPVVTALRPGTVRFHAEGVRHEVVVSDGFAEIMPQPFSVAEQFTGLEGRYVTLEDTISGFEALLGGELDQYPEAAFSMVGTVDEVRRKAQDMGAL